MTQSTRRTVLQVALAVGAVQALPLSVRAQSAAPPRFEPKPGDWRTFVVTTTVTAPQSTGVTQLWLPVANVQSDYQKSLDSTWTAGAGTARLVSDPKSQVRMLYAELPAGPAQTVTVTSKVQTRSRAVDWSRTEAAHEDGATLKRALASSELQPHDGAVLKTAQTITAGAKTDVDKVRAIYDWVVTTGYRDPKVRGCGSGNVKVMLESGNMGGKCADLNSLFACLCAAVGVPSREVFGLRVAPSAFGYRELGGNPASLKGAQHCRAEVYLQQYGWVAMDPADVLKVMRQENPEWIRDIKDPLIAPVNAALFGGWEGNWIGWNTGRDVSLPDSGSKDTLPFLMYPQGKNAAGRFDELDADAFKYSIAAREITA